MVLDIATSLQSPVVRVALGVLAAAGPVRAQLPPQPPPGSGPPPPAASGGVPAQQVCVYALVMLASNPAPGVARPGLPPAPPPGGAPPTGFAPTPGLAPLSSGGLMRGRLRHETVRRVQR